MTITVAALVGDMLTPRPGLATLPISFQFVGTMVATFPASLLMGRYGRKLGFSLGAVLGVITCLLAAWSITEHHFIGYCIAMFIGGMSAACAMFYRFAAAESVETQATAKAISWVLAGGIIAAFLGPTIATVTKELVPDTPFAGTYMAAIVLHLGVLALMAFSRFPAAIQDTRQGANRPWSDILSQPKILVAIFCGMVAYGAMNLVMVPTPLAMTAHNHVFETAAFVIQWHVVGMYAPSFFAGHLIARFGTRSMLNAGAILILLATTANLSGTGALQFWLGLTLLGVGWNFMYISASTLLTECYHEAERAKVQGLNDFLIFTMTVITSLSAGFVFNLMGWEAVNLLVILPVALSILTVTFVGRQSRTYNP